MKKLLAGVMLMGMVLVMSSCMMSDETYADINQTYRVEALKWLRSFKLSDETRAEFDAMSVLKQDKIYEGILEEACIEHGTTLAAYERKAKSVERKSLR